MKSWKPEELEKINCDFCGSCEVCAEYIRDDGMKVVECGVCGLAYLNPRPLGKFIPRFYEQDYFTGVSAERGEGGLRLKLRTEDRDGRTVNKCVPRPIELMNGRFGGIRNKDVLEIGCATGDLLTKMVSAGARARGLEISDFAAEIARKRGLDVMTGTVEDHAAGLHGGFDIVMAFEVIEHVLSPMRFLNAVAGLVRPQGLLILSTPNYACAHEHREKWDGFTSSFEHLYFFNADTLKRLAFRAGFSMKYWETSLIEGVAAGQQSFFPRQIKRLNTATSLVKQYGVRRTIAMRTNGTPGFLSYGSGHTLITVFQRYF